MKINKYIVEGFKIHKHTEIDLRNLTVLTGTNSGGKSSIIQSLLLLRQRQQVGGENVVKLNGSYVNLGSVGNVLYEKAQDSFVQMELQSGDKKFRMVFDAMNGEKDYLPLSTTEGENNLLNDLNLFGDNIQYISNARIAANDSIASDDKKVEEKQLSTRLGVCDLIAPYLHQYGEIDAISVDSNLRCDGNEDGNLIAQVSAWESQMSKGVSVKPVLLGDKYVVRYVYDREDGMPGTAYKPENVGSGLNAALPVITALLSSNMDGLLIIENPESGLHPKAQSKLTELICRAAQNGLQIILETHSDHIINGILVNSKRYENGEKGIDRNQVKIYFFSRNDEDMSSVKDEVVLVGDGKIDHQPADFCEQQNEDLQYILGF